MAMSDKEFRKVEEAAKLLRRVSNLKVSGCPPVIDYLASHYEEFFKVERERRLKESKV